MSATEGAGAPASAPKRKKGPDGEAVPAETPAAAAASSSPPPATLIQTPSGQGRLVDLGGQGDCAFRALAFTSGRARGESDTKEWRDAALKGAISLRARVVGRIVKHKDLF
eukprot:6687526-Alexandrium_andersonii.AAC.1